jgi:hypothetical protein
MAVRFITPVETPYESQFVPMPLDFMYKALQEKQKGLDTTRGDIGSADLKIESAPWDTSKAQKYREKFSGDVSSLSSRLEKDKSGYGAIAQQLKSLNREYNTDPEFQRIIQHQAAYKKNVEPLLGKGNSNSAYFRGMMELDPQTNTYKWKDGSQIALEDIKAPILDDTEKYITENVLNALKPSLKESYGEGQFATAPDGSTVWQSPDGRTLEHIDLTNQFTANAIKQFAERMYQGTNEQDFYAKEFKLRRNEKGETIGRGYSTLEDLEELVGNVVSKGFYRKETMKPGTTRPAGDGGGGSGGLTPKELVYEVSSFGGEEQPILDLESLASADSEIKRKKTEADGLLYGAIIAANKDRAYAPMFADVFGTSDAGNKGAVEAAFDDILSLKVDNLNQEGDTRTAQVLQGVLQDSSTFVKAISGDPVRAFAPGGRLETDYYFNKNEVEVIKELMYSEVLGIKNSGSANSEDLTAANTFLTAYNDAKEYERITNEQNKIALGASEAVAKNKNTTTEEVVKLAKIGELIEKHKGKSYTSSDINNSEELKFLQANGIFMPERLAFGRTSSTDFVVAQKRLTDNGLSYYEYSDNGNYARNTAKEVKAEFAKETKVEERKIIRETTQGDKKGAMASFSKTSLENYKNSPTELVSLLQQTAAEFGKAGKDYRNKGTLGEIFGSDENPFKMDGFDENNFELSEVIFKITNTGVPMLIVSARNKENNNITSGAEIMFDMENKGQQFSEIVTQMATDDDPKVRDIAASWMGAATIKKADLGVAKMYFDSGIADKAKETKKDSQLVYFEDNKNQKYGLQTTAAGQTKFGKVKEDGTLEPFLSYKNNDGIEVDPNNVESFNEMLEIFGHYKISNIGVQGTSSTSGQGGTTVGKSPIRQGQLWTPK